MEGLLQCAAAWQGCGGRLASGPGDPVEFRYSDLQIASESTAGTADFLHHQFCDPQKAFCSLQYGTAFTPTKPSYNH